MGQLPGLKKKPFYCREWFVWAFSEIPALLAGAGAVYSSLTATPFNGLVFGFVLAVAVFVAIRLPLGLLAARWKDRLSKDSEDTRNLRGPLQVLHAEIAQTVNQEGGKLAKNSIRVCIHAVNGGKLEQLVNYVVGPDEEGNGVGRTFNPRAGIIGKCLLKKTPLIAERTNDDYDSFLQEMVDDWRMSQDEAKDILKDRRCWAAIPITGAGGTVIAVLYVDSSIQGLFAQPEVRDRLVAGCIGLTAFIKERYDPSITIHDGNDRLEARQ